MKSPKNPKGAGRKHEGRVRAALYLLPEALDVLDAYARAGATTRGKIIEALVIQKPV